MQDPVVISALISGFIALLGVTASIIASRLQLKLQKHELELKSKELDTLSKRLQSEIEAIRQSQFTEVLKKRMDAYPKVWETVVEHTLKWDNENKLRNHEWAKLFLKKLDFCNLEAGVFFSQAVYGRFHELTEIMVALERKLAAEREVTENDLYAPDRIFIGENENSGLATYLKDDLGSYRVAALQARLTSNLHDNDTNKNIELRERLSTIAPISALLKIIENSGSEKLQDISGTTRIGTSPKKSNLLLNSQPKANLINPLHCTIGHNGDMFWIKDENSTHGTYLNGEKLVPQKLCYLNHGDLIEIGNPKLGSRKFYFYLPYKLSEEVFKNGMQYQ